MSHLIFQLSDLLKITNAEKIFHNFVADCRLGLKGFSLTQKAGRVIHFRDGAEGWLPVNGEVAARTQRIRDVAPPGLRKKHLDPASGRIAMLVPWNARPVNGRHRLAGLVADSTGDTEPSPAVSPGHKISYSPGWEMVNGAVRLPLISATTIAPDRTIISRELSQRTNAFI